MRENTRRFVGALLAAPFVAYAAPISGGSRPCSLLLCLLAVDRYNPLVGDPNR